MSTPSALGPQDAAAVDDTHASRERDRPLREAQKSYHTILEQQVEEASEELERTTLGILLSSLSAGLDMGFGPFLMAVALTLVQDTWSHAAAKLLLANAYAAGF